MTLKTKHEKTITHNIIIIPILFIIFFTVLAFFVLQFYFLPKNNEIWQTKITQEYYENQKRIIKEEAIKIYNLLIDERNEGNEFLKRYLKQQNEIFAATIKGGGKYNITDTTLNFKHISYSKIEDSTSDLINKALKVGKEGLITWEENGKEYQGYFFFYEKYFYITYVDIKKQLQEDRRVVLKKIMNLKYASENYIFVLGENGKIYGHFKKELLENNNLKEADPRRYENLKLIVDFAKENGEGFIQYKTGSKTNPEFFEDKISYVIYDKEWGLTLGIGLTKSYIEEKIAKEEAFKDKLLKDTLYYMGVMAGIYILIHAMMMFFFGKIVARRFLIYKDLLTVEKEKTIHSLHTQNKYLAPKENMIDSLVPFAITDKDFNLTNCTKKFGNLFGINTDDIYGESLYKLLTLESQYKLRYFSENKDEKQLEIKDSIFYTFNNNQLWLTVIINKENKDKNIPETWGYSVICEEVSEKINFKNKFNKEQEKTLVQEQIILQQSKLAAIGTTVDSIAHQWKQPLAVVSGEISNLIIKVRKNKNQDGTIALSVLQENIEKIEQTINFLSETVETFNTFYDATEDNMKIDLSKLIKDTFKIMIPSSSANIYKIEYNVEDEVYAYGAKGLYQQVVLTLIHNAIEAFREKNIKDRQFYIGIKNEGEFNVVTIEDNAGGIDEKIIKNIFDRNFSTKKKDKLGNSGLGLFLANIVLKEKFQNGSISVRNTSHGAAFTIKTKNIAEEN